MMDNIRLTAAILVIALSGCCVCQTLTSLKADIHMKGVQGTAMLEVSETNLTITFTMQQSIGQTTVEVRRMWVKYDVIAADKCSSTSLGSLYLGPSTTSDLSTSSQTQVVLTNAPSLRELDGLSLVLRYNNNNDVVCATIEQDADYVTGVVRFRSSTVFGDVQLRQALTSGSGTRIISDLATRQEFTSADWRITNSFRTCEDFKKDVMVNIYSPGTTGSGTCSQTQQQNCQIGDLTGKLGKVSLANDLGGRQAFTDINLPLNGTNSIGHLLMIIIPDSLAVEPACGVVHIYSERVARVTFSHDGVSGTVEFKQRSPLDPAITTVALEGLANTAGGWHVHKWPVPEKVSSSQGSMCANEYVSGHHNPYISDVGVPGDGSYPANSADTDDKYEMGDLSGKYGSFAGKSGETATYTDWNLQLFGTHSIVGRSVVIHRSDASASRWVCANIEPQYDVIAAEAVLLYPVYGRIKFMQSLDFEGDETSVFAKLDYVDSTSDSGSHHWMLTDKPIGTDMLDDAEASRCDSAGTDTYDPEHLWTGYSSNDYMSICTVNGAIACKTGDITGQLGELGYLNIGDAAGTSDKSSEFFQTAMFLPLSGPNSIIGKSLVVKATSGSDSLACATIQPVHPTALSAQLTSGSVTGTVMFKQKVGFGEKQTDVQLELSGMTGAETLAIHELPPDYKDSSPCEASGLEYNPLMVGIFSKTTDDMYPIGNLNRFSTMTSWMQYNLPLSGANSIRGRSLVVLSSQGNLVSCGEILMDGTGWTMIEANATFTGELEGSISMYQHVNSDGAMTDTTILMNVGYTGANTQTMSHNWHTHIYLVNGDSMADADRCQSTGGHYNPFKVDVGSAAYTTDCSPHNQLRCELGDQAMKTATYNLGGGRKLFNDVYLPLIGNFTVQGRSFVIHADNKGAPRRACADITPKTSNPIDVYFTTPSSFSGKTNDEIAKEITATYAEAIRAYSGEVIAVVTKSTNSQTNVQVHFIGTRSSELRSRFVSVMENDEKGKELGQFQPEINSAGTMKGSIILVTLAILNILYQAK